MIIKTNFTPLLYKLPDHPCNHIDSKFSVHFLTWNNANSKYKIIRDFVDVDKLIRNDDSFLIVHVLFNRYNLNRGSRIQHLILFLDTRKQTCTAAKRKDEGPIISQSGLGTLPRFSHEP